MCGKRGRGHGRHARSRKKMFEREGGVLLCFVFLLLDPHYRGCVEVLSREPGGAHGLLVIGDLDFHVVFLADTSVDVLHTGRYVEALARKGEVTGPTVGRTGEDERAANGVVVVDGPAGGAAQVAGDELLQGGLPRGGVCADC